MPIYNSPIFSIDAAETKRYAGLQKADFSQQFIEDACREAQLLIQPRGIWHIYDYDARQQRLYTPDGSAIILQGASIGRHLQGCCKAAVIAATVGEAIENQVTKFFAEGRYSFSVLLDAAATAAVEQTADAMEKNIKNEVQRQGLAMQWRFSPGYGDWPIQQQTDILRLAQGEAIGISLTSSMMLLPRKSLTAIIGLYHPAAATDCKKQNKKQASCQSCSKTDCPARVN